MKRNIVAIDSSCLIALQADEELANKIKQKLYESWDAYCSEMAILETQYILCRKKSFEIASKKISALVESNVIQIVPIKDLLENASKLKCERSIAIADCLTIALAEKLNSKAIFYQQERELKDAIEKKPFQVKIEFFTTRVRESTVL
ncbi:MAG: PIN domain-containing protein [Promethearchaeia archaeon]